jgi:thiol-disulfide isomerase/thioredoxin
MKKTITSLLLCLLFAGGILAASVQGNKKDTAPTSKGKHHIEIKINGVKDTKLMLGYYFDSSKYVMDTVPVNHEGVAVLKGDSLIYPGVYIAILPDMTNFDFLIDKNNQEFSIETSKDNLWGSLKFNNSQVNTDFISYQKYMKQKQEQVAAIQQKGKENPSDPEAQKQIAADLSNIDHEVRAKWAELRTKENDNLLALLISLVESPSMPNFNIPDNEPKKDSILWSQRYSYQKEHYWDNINLSDARLLRTPIFASRLRNYFTNILVQAPDSLKPEVDKFIAKTAGNKDVYQYCVSYLLNYYNKSNIMSHDEVFLHIADKYYLSGKAPWSTKDLLTKLAERADKLRPNLIGKVAPNLVLESETGEYVALNQVNSKFTVVYFWEPDCSHCQKETPLLYDLYNKVRNNGVQVYAIYTQYKKDEWTKYLAEKGFDWINVWDANYNSNFRTLYNITSTPTIYLLDKDKKIIAKRISVETLEKILNEINPKQ